MTVLVADNDAEGREGLAVCQRLRGSYRWPLHPSLAPQRGIAHVRNALVETALARPAMQFLAMLDDDEWPEPQWLDALLKEQSATACLLRYRARSCATSKKRRRAGRHYFDGMSHIRHASGAVET